VILWYRLGDCLVLHAGHRYGRIYHDCETSQLKKIRVLYLDVVDFFQRPEEAKLPEILEKAQCTPCACDLRERIKNPQGIPFAYHFKLGL
jgi:hypothetical protein